METMSVAFPGYRVVFVLLMAATAILKVLVIGGPLQTLYLRVHGEEVWVIIIAVFSEIVLIKETGFVFVVLKTKIKKIH